MAPDYFLWNTHYPEGRAIISGKDKLPPPPNFTSCRWPDFIGIILAIPAEVIFMTIVMLARVKAIVRAVFLDIDGDS